MTRASRRRPDMPEEVAFPVTPMLDMAFQLLAFFVLTFQVPSRETRLDLYLPSAPVALPGKAQGAPGVPVSPADADLETDLVVRAEADDGGNLKALRLGDTPLRNPASLGERLERYGQLLGGRPVRVVLVADDTLRYQEAADLIGTCSSAGVGSIRLADAAARRGASPPGGPR
jgi:biopolymer transport protein ExbD